MPQDLWLFLALLAPIVCNCKPSQKTTENHCYSTDEVPYLLFSTKTAYDYTHGNLNEDVVPETCIPIQFWAFNRHGTRYPDATEIETFGNLGGVLKEVVSNYEEGKSSLCEEDFNLLKTWIWDDSIDTSMAKDLTEQGYKDLAGIAKRYKKKFPELFITPYKKKNYYFRCSNSDRAKDSLDGYVGELFGSDCDVKYKQSNKVIKEYKKCTSWGEEDYKEDYETFVTTPLYRKMLQGVSQRLGFSESLNVSTVEAMYLACAFEKAWYVNQISPWCATFTQDDLLILEYSEDLQSYYKSGYGRYESNKALGCPILNDLFTRFQNTISGDTDEPKVAVQFSHSTALHQFLLNLGLYEDEKELNGYNYAEQLERKWRTSLFGPFATNVAVVLYNCSDADEPYQIEVFVDERPEVICSGGKLCSWSEFVGKYEKAAESCNLDFCEAKLC